jgi:MFS family permease
MTGNTKRNRKKLFLLNLFSFLLGFQAILVIYVMSSFLKENTGFLSVEAVYLVSALASFFLLINLHFLIKKFGKSKVFIYSLIICFFALLSISMLGGGYLSVFWVAIYLTINVIIWVAMDILVENFSQDKITGSIRGKYLALMNAGCLFGPFLALWLVNYTGTFQPLFFLSAIIVMVVMILAVINFSDVNHRYKKSPSLLSVIKKMIKKKNIARIYYISFILEFFYAAMVVYTPIYLLGLGLEWLEIGKIFTVMLIPFALIQYPLGKFADKKTGEKEWLIFAILLMGISTALISFVGTSSIILWMIVLFVTRIGAAIIELMRDSYFYKQIDVSDIDMIDFFRTTKSVAYVMAMLIFGLFLFIFPTYQTVFLLLGAIVLTGLIPALKLKDTR